MTITLKFITYILDCKLTYRIVTWTIHSNNQRNPKKSTTRI